MGITIHFQGRLRDPLDVEKIIEEVSDIAETLDWAYQTVSGGALRGISFTPHPQCETVIMLFDEEGYLRNPVDDNTDESRVLFVQTQFSPANVHVAVIKLLRHLAKRYFHELTVIDEGDYWRSEDLSRLIAKREQQLREMKKVEKAIKDASLSPDDEPDDIASKIEDCFRRLEDEENLN